MENYEYNRIFPLESEDDVDPDPDEAESIKRFLHGYERDLTSTPRFLLPLAPEIFRKTVVECEKIAKEFSGRIKAKIDYSLFTATIELWCCYVEFTSREFMNILHKITHYAISVRFTPLTSGDLHIEILMPYFVSAQIIEEIDPD